MQEGGSVEEFARKPQELRNRLSSMGEKVFDNNMNEVVSSGLPRSYDSMVQTLTYVDDKMTFEKLCANLFTEQYRQEHRTHLHREEEALAVTFNGRGRGRGRWSQRTYVARGGFYHGHGQFRPQYNMPPPNVGGVVRGGAV